MYIIMLARGIPSKYYPQWGCFEKDQAEALATYGHKVIVLSVDGRFKQHRGSLGMHHIIHNGVEYYNYVIVPEAFFIKTFGLDCCRKKVRDYYFDKLYRRVIADHGKPDLIYAHFFFNMISGAQLKQKYHIPLVGIEHLARFNLETIPQETKMWADFAFHSVGALISVSKSLAENIERNFGVKSSVVHNMFGPEFGEGSVHDGGPTTGKIVFVSTASLTYRKGFDFLIKAFAKAQLPKAVWRLNIIGRGEEKNNLEQLIACNNLQENIFLLGRKGKAEIVEELSASNVFVLPSRNENFSVAILEGLAMGLPVIATDCGGIRECLDDKNGIIVPVDDIDSMAAAITQMIGMYTQYDRKYIAENCRKRFSPIAIAEKLTKVFVETLKSTSQVD